jgi:uncharacterized protein YndB with AHSA1/START domain
MTVTSVHKDPDALTMTMTVDLEATAERAWELWADPRQLERWWGPPGYPATFVDHDLLTVGSRSTYYMTSPEGEKYHGWWEVVAVEPPRRLEVNDGFADDTGKPNDDMPVGRMVVTLDEQDGHTEMVITSHFPTLEAMEQLLEMGQEEGMVEAIGQIEEILADPASAS